MADAKLAPELFLQPGTAENYAQIARDNAKAEGTTPKAAMEKLGKAWREMHTRLPLDGYDRLADWAETFDPGDGLDSNREAFEVYRAVESAKREPKLAYQSHPDAIDAATEALKVDDDVTLPDGVQKNSGPVTVTPKDGGKKSSNVVAK